MVPRHQSMLLSLVCVLALGACLCCYVIAHLVLLADQVIAFLFGLALIN
jgi:hypothetical protein